MSHEHEFEETFVALYPRVVRLAYQILGDWTGAEDVAAESFLRALSAWERLRSPEGWIVRVATNLALERLRSDRTTVADDFDEPRDSTEGIALRLTIVDALRRLPKRQRETIVLRYFAGLKQWEVADLLGITPGSVKTHAHRGLAALRVDLQEQEERDMAVTSVQDAVRVMRSGEVVPGVVRDFVMFGAGGAAWPLTRQSRHHGMGYAVDIGIPAYMHNQETSLQLGFTGEDMRWLIGLPVDVKVVDVDPDAGEVWVSRRAVLETERIAALRNALLEELAAGQQRTGKVTLVLPFGAFVDLEGTYGLLPVGEFASTDELEELATSEGRESFKDRRNAAKEGVARGRGVRVEIVSVDRERQRAVLKLVR